MYIAIHENLSSKLLLYFSLIFIIRKAAAQNIRNLFKIKSFSKMEKMLACRWLKTKILYQLYTL